MKIISGLLILVLSFLSLKHAWDGIKIDRRPEQAQMMDGLGIGKSGILAITVVSLAIGVMVLIPQTFFIANVINALMIVMIMSLALNTGNIKLALIEIPFLLMPLLLIWLGHPLKK